MVKITEKLIQETVDALGRVKAQASILAEKEKDLRAVLLEAHEEGQGDAFNGSLFRATISEYEQSTVSKEALVAKLEKLLDAKAFAAFIKRNTETKTAVRLSVKARIVETAEAA